MSQPLLPRTQQFALMVLEFCRRLPGRPEADEVARQLRAAATSVRSNYRAARRGRSRAEFQAKLQIAAEEAEECVDWLEYLRDGEIADDPRLLQEARELSKILGKAAHTARVNTAAQRAEVAARRRPT